MKKQRFTVVLAALLFASVAIPAPRVDQIPFRLIGGAIVIRCKLLDDRGIATPTDCLLDTGTSVTSVDTSFRLKSARDEGAVLIDALGERTPVLLQKQTILLPLVKICRGAVCGKSPDLVVKVMADVCPTRLLLTQVRAILGEVFL